jgi:hypothetical protein
MTANEQNLADATETPRTRPRFSPGRVVLALLFVAFVGIVAIIVCEALASSRASNVYHQVAQLLQQGDSKPAFEADVNEALKILPSHSDNGDYEFQDDYIFDGLFSTYTVRVTYWQFRGDKYKKLVAVKMFEQRRFFDQPTVSRGAQ